MKKFGFIMSIAFSFVLGACTDTSSIGEGGNTDFYPLTESEDNLSPRLRERMRDGEIIIENSVVDNDEDELRVAVEDEG